jgi:MFS family permease
MLLHCSELFPTLIRSAVLGYQNMAARVGGIIAPFIVMASAGGAGGGNLVPFLTFGVASVLAGLLIFTLPETLGVPLPDTMEVSCQWRAQTSLLGVWVCMCVSAHTPCWQPTPWPQCRKFN